MGKWFKSRGPWIWMTGGAVSLESGGRTGSVVADRLAWSGLFLAAPSMSGS